MSIQKENIIYFAASAGGKPFPLEAELALVVGAVGEMIRKGGLFRRIKEQLTQVSKFYWRLLVDNYDRRLILVDTLGLYGGGTGIQDLTLPEVEARAKMILNASTLNTFKENLQEANRILILSTNNYPVFDQRFTRSTLQLVKRQISEGMIDAPLILPSFEETISEGFLQSQSEISRYREIQDEIQDVTMDWLAEINDKIAEIEREYAGRLARLRENVNDRIENYHEKMNTTIDANHERANKAVMTELARFERSCSALTGVIAPLQEISRNTIREIPPIETPKFQSVIEVFLRKSQKEISTINSQLKNVDNSRKNLAKAINAISQEMTNSNQKAMDDFEQKKLQAQTEIDQLFERRDRAISTLIDLRETINQNYQEINNKIQLVINNRLDLAKEATEKQSGSIPENILLSLYLVKFEEKDSTRYFVIPPLGKPRGRVKDYDYPIAEMNSAIIGGKKAVDKIAGELVFNRRLKSSFEALKGTNYVATGEFAGAVKEGLKFLGKNKMISKKGGRRILDILDDLGF